MKPCLVFACLALLVYAAGCLDRNLEAKNLESPKSNSSTSGSPEKYTSTTKPEVTSTTAVPAYYGNATEDLGTKGCECVQWVCPGTRTVAPPTTAQPTSTTCITIEDDSYLPTTRHYDVRIKDGRFRPSEIIAYRGDTIIVNITNTQGLHRIRETYTNKTIVMKPNESYELIFYALKEGENLLTCNPFCVEPMEAKIVVEPRSSEICG